MSTRNRIFQLLVSVLLLGVLGCGPASPIYLTSKNQVDKHYINTATRIEYPDTHVETSQEVLGALAPLTVANPNPTEIYDLTLEEAVCVALRNSKVVRTLSGVGFSSAGVQGVPQAILSNPNGVATVYDIALVETDPRYGVEAALSAFDAQLKSTVGWSTQNRGTPMTKPGNYYSDTSQGGSFQTSLQKTTAAGSTFYMTNGNNYTDSKAYATSFPYWQTYLEAGVSQPLLQGRGVQFNRIAGPGAIPGFYNGVSIARMNTDTTLADFEMATRNLVFDVERAYWNLYYAYHYLESVKAGYQSASQTWHQVKQKYDLGAKEGTAVAEAQARNQYYIFRSRAEQAQSNLFKMDATLKYIMGLAATDGRLFKPSTEPSVAPLKLDWNDIVVEALVRSPELRKQKWVVKQKELELLASKNYLLPRLDLNAGYRWNGIGDKLVDTSTNQSSAYNSLTHDGMGDWQAGLSFSAPIGFRREMAAHRNAKIALTRAQSILQEQELELSNQLSDAVRDLAQYHQLMQTSLQNRLASQDELTATTRAYEVGKTTIDYVLDSQRRLAEAETGFYNNVVQYNIAISELHRRKGTLLEYNNVYLAEGPWPNKAYVDARELARKRDAGHNLNYGYTRPQVYSRGTYQQFQGVDMTSGDGHKFEVQDSGMPEMGMPIPPNSETTFDFDLFDPQSRTSQGSSQSARIAQQSTQQFQPLQQPVPNGMMQKVPAPNLNVASMNANPQASNVVPVAAKSEERVSNPNQVQVTQVPRPLPQNNVIRQTAPTPSVTNVRPTNPMSKQKTAQGTSQPYF
ncbi:MAG: TolC family protein [Thermoguttaceae bacterium]